VLVIRLSGKQSQVYPYFDRLIKYRNGKTIGELVEEAQNEKV